MLVFGWTQPLRGNLRIALYGNRIKILKFQWLDVILFARIHNQVVEGAIFTYLFQSIDRDRSSRL